MLFPATTLLVKMCLERSAERDKRKILKYFLPLNMARAQAEAIQNRPAPEGVHPQAAEEVLRLFYKKALHIGAKRQLPSCLFCAFMLK